MALISLISIVQKNFKLLTPPKVWVSGFPSVNRNGISVLAIKNKYKNCSHFVNIDRMEKIQITDLPKFQSPDFQVSMETEKKISVSHYEKIDKWLSFH